MNWKLRLKNKTTLITLIAAAVSLVYQILAVVGIMPKISEANIISVAGVVVNMLCILGIVVDPTTAGMADSDRALSYTEPVLDKKEEEET